MKPTTAVDVRLRILRGEFGQLFLIATRNDMFMFEVIEIDEDEIERRLI